MIELDDGVLLLPNVFFRKCLVHLSKLRYKGSDSNLDFLHSSNLDKNSELGIITIFRPDKSRLSSRIRFLVLLMAGSLAAIGGESKIRSAIYAKLIPLSLSQSVTQTATSQRRRSDVAV